MKAISVTPRTPAMILIQATSLATRLSSSGGQDARGAARQSIGPGVALRFVQAAAPDDEGAGSDHVVFYATADRKGADPGLDREIPGSREARRGLLERRHVFSTFGDQLGLDGGRHRLPGPGSQVEDDQ